VNKLEVRKLLEQITGLYLNIKLSPDTANIWAECLQDISYEQARHNLVEYVKKNKFAPTIADIRGVRKVIVNNGNYCEVTGRTYDLYKPPDPPEIAN